MTCHCSYCASGRWPPRPRRGDKCEGFVGWREDWLGAPVLIKCGNDAVETVMVGETVHVQAYVCDTHAEQGFRNPRAKRAPRPEPHEAFMKEQGQ